MFKRALLALAASFTLLMPVHATSVLPLYLDEIVDTAAVAFEGIVLGNRTTREESGAVVTYTTFQVMEVLKGNVGETYTIKQIGGEMPAEGIVQKTYGVPRFTAGQNVVVFLYGVSSAGFSSPVGLEQGRFHVTGGAEGLQVGNGRDFRELAERMTNTASESAKAKLASDKPVKQMRLDEFKQMVRNRAAGRVERSEQ